MIACVASAAAFLILFARRERKAAFPLIELRLFRGGGFTAGILGVALGYALLSPCSFCRRTRCCTAGTTAPA